MGVSVCRKHVQSLEAGVKRLFCRRRNFLKRLALLARSSNSLVIYIGDVHHHFHLILLEGEIPPKEVTEQISPVVAYMTSLVNGRTTRINMHNSGAYRCENLLTTGKGIV